MNHKEVKKRLKTMYDGQKTENNYWFWFWKLYNIVSDIFEYDNIPRGTNKKSITDNLILLGYCSFIALRDGRIFTPFSHIFDYDEFYQPRKMVYANPRITDYKQYKIGVDCEVVYNTTNEFRCWNLKTDTGFFTFISKYARMLADVESTIAIYTINNRSTSYPVADDMSIAESIKAFFDKLALGERAVISDNSIIEQFRTVEMGKANLKDGINDWLIARDKILEMFFRDIGVRMYNPKKAQVTEDEIEVNNQLLVISIDDCMKAQNEGFERVNNMFGTNIKARINPKYSVETMDVSRETSVKGGGDNV